MTKSSSLLFLFLTQFPVLIKSSTTHKLIIEELRLEKHRNKILPADETTNANLKRRYGGMDLDKTRLKNYKHMKNIKNMNRLKNEMIRLAESLDHREGRSLDVKDTHYELELRAMNNFLKLRREMRAKKNMKVRKFLKACVWPKTKTGFLNMNKIKNR